MLCEYCRSQIRNECYLEDPQCYQNRSYQAPLPQYQASLPSFQGVLTHLTGAALEAEQRACSNPANDGRWYCYGEAGECPMRYDGFRNEKTLKQHCSASRHHMFACEICNEEFDKVIHVQEHRLRAHPGHTDTGQSSASGPFKCPYCPEGFNNEETLRQHLYFNHAGRRNDPARNAQLQAQSSSSYGQSAPPSQGFGGIAPQMPQRATSQQTAAGGAPCSGCQQRLPPDAECINLFCPRGPSRRQRSTQAPQRSIAPAPPANPPRSASQGDLQMTGYPGPAAPSQIPNIPKASISSTNEDWRTATDRKEKKRMQNRINQRNLRKRRRAARGAPLADDDDDDDEDDDEDDDDDEGTHGSSVGNHPSRQPSGQTSYEFIQQEFPRPNTGSVSRRRPAPQASQGATSQQSSQEPCEDCRRRTLQTIQTCFPNNPSCRKKTNTSSSGGHPAQQQTAPSQPNIPQRTSTPVSTQAMGAYGSTRGTNTPPPHPGATRSTSSRFGSPSRHPSATGLHGSASPQYGGGDDRMSPSPVSHFPAVPGAGTGLSGTSQSQTRERGFSECSSGDSAGGYTSTDYINPYGSGDRQQRKNRDFSPASLARQLTDVSIDGKTKSKSIPSPGKGPRTRSSSSNNGSKQPFLFGGSKGTTTSSTSSSVSVSKSATPPPKAMPAPKVKSSTKSSPKVENVKIPNLEKAKAQKQEKPKTTKPKKDNTAKEGTPK